MNPKEPRGTATGVGPSNIMRVKGVPKQGLCHVIPGEPQPKSLVWHSPTWDNKRGSLDHHTVWGVGFEVVMQRTFENYTRFIMGRRTKCMRRTNEYGKILKKKGDKKFWLCVNRLLFLCLTVPYTESLQSNLFKLYFIG